MDLDAMKQVIYDDTISSGTITTSDTTAGTLTEEQWQGFLKDWGSRNKLVTASTPYFYGWDIYDDIMKNKKKDKDMMGLYRVYAVDTKLNEELGEVRVIAKTSQRAVMKSQNKFIDDAADNDDIEFWTELVFEWESKKPKEVKIVKE